MRLPEIKDPFLFGEWFGLYWFHSCYVTGLTETIRERLGYGLNCFVAELEGDVQRFYFSRLEWTEIGRRYLEEVIAEPAKLEALLSDIRKAADGLMNFSRDLKKVVADQEIPGTNLAAVVRAYHGHHHAVWSLGQVPNVLELENSFLTDYLKVWLKERGLAPDEVQNAFQALVTPRELSLAQKEERAMLGLAQAENPGDSLTNHWQTYSWLQFGWTGPSLTREYFQEVQRGLYREGQAEAKLAQVLARDKGLLADKETWAERLCLPVNIRRLFRLLEETLFVKAHRMDALFMSYEAIEPVLRRIAREHYLSLGQVYALYPDMLSGCLEKGEFDPHLCNQLMTYSARYYDGQATHLLLGDEAHALVDPVKAKLPPPPPVNEVKGECAFPGVVRGRVSIVNRAQEMDKFANGDILVSNVTDPTLLPIMKKASAFVTNMGGMTCHAAIVARELQKPCVVGTKIATRIFKDGEMIEVDAGAGIARRL